MQKCPIYLYPNSLDVTLDLDQNTRTNNVMYQRQLQIQKGLKTKVQIQFKNSDQKRLSISNTQTFVFTMFDAVTKRQLVKKPIEILDEGSTATTYASKGLGLVEFIESDTLDLDIGTYGFTIFNQETNGSYTPAYSNTYYSVSGVLELRQDSYAVAQPSVDIPSVVFENASINNLDTGYRDFYSGRIDAQPQFNGNNALHTMAFYLTNFKGNIYIQGTLDNSPDTNSNWVTIETLNYNTNKTGIIYKNFEGVWSWVRVKHIPEKNASYGDQNYLGPSNPSNPTPGKSFYPNGKIDRLLYRS